MDAETKGTPGWRRVNDSAKRAHPRSPIVGEGYLRSSAFICGFKGGPSFPSAAPAGFFNAFQFGGDVRAMVKREPTGEAAVFAGRAVGKLRIGVQTRHGRVRPRAVA